MNGITGICVVILVTAYVQTDGHPVGFGRISSTAIKSTPTRMAKLMGSIEKYDGIKDKDRKPSSKVIVLDILCAACIEAQNITCIQLFCENQNLALAKMELNPQVDVGLTDNTLDQLQTLPNDGARAEIRQAPNEPRIRRNFFNKVSGRY